MYGPPRQNFEAAHHFLEWNLHHAKSRTLYIGPGWDLRELTQSNQEPFRYLVATKDFELGAAIIIEDPAWMINYTTPHLSAALAQHPEKTPALVKALQSQQFPILPVLRSKQFSEHDALEAVRSHGCSLNYKDKHGHPCSALLMVQFANFLNHHHGRANTDWVVEAGGVSGFHSVVRATCLIRKDDVLSVKYESNTVSDQCYCPPCFHSQRSSGGRFGRVVTF